MASRLSAEIPGGADAAPRGEGAAAQLPEFLHAPFAAAMSQAMLLPAFVALFGVVAALFLLGFVRTRGTPPPAPGAGDHSVPDPVGLAHHAGLAHPAGRTHHVDLADDDEFADDDDDYVEYLVHRDGDTGNGWGGEDATVTEAVTEPLVGASPAARSTAADQPEWRSIAEQLLAAAEREDSGDGPTGHGRHSRAAD